MEIRIITHVFVILSALEIKYTESIDNVERIVKQPPLLSASIAPESQPMVSAVLLECPKELKESLNSDRPGKRPREGKQLMVNIRVNPSFHIEKVEKFLILDELYDSHKRSKAKIMSPYLIEISRGEPVMMYPLEFSKSVKIEDDKQPVNESSDTTTSPKEDKLEDNAQTASLNRVMSKITASISPVTKINSSNFKEKPDVGNKPVKEQPSKQKNAVIEINNFEETDTLRRQVTPDLSSIKKNDKSQVNNNAGLNIGYLTSESIYQNDLSDQNKHDYLKVPSIANVGVERRLIKHLEDTTRKGSNGKSEVKNKVNPLKTKNLVKQSNLKLQKDTLQSGHGNYIENRNQISQKKVQSKRDGKNEPPNALGKNRKNEKFETSVHDDGADVNEEVKPYGYIQSTAIVGRRPSFGFNKRKQHKLRAFRKRPSKNGLSNDGFNYNIPGQYIGGSLTENGEYLKDYFRPCNCEMKSVYGSLKEVKPFDQKTSLKTSNLNIVRDEILENRHNNGDFLKLKPRQKINEDGSYESRKISEPERNMARVNRKDCQFYKDSPCKLIITKEEQLLGNASFFKPNLYNSINEYQFSEHYRPRSHIVARWSDYDIDENEQKFPRSNTNHHNKDLGSSGYMQIKGLRKLPFSRKMYEKSVKQPHRYEKLEMIYQPNKHLIDHDTQLGYTSNAYDNGKIYEKKPELNKIAFVVAPSKEKYKANKNAYYKSSSYKNTVKNKQKDGGSSKYKLNYEGRSSRVNPFSNARFSPQLNVDQNGLKRTDERNEVNYNSLWDEPSLPYIETYANIESRERKLEPSLTYNRDLYPIKTSEASRGSAEKILSQEPEIYLPRKLPFQKVLDDPNLNLNDKLNMIELMDPHNEAADEKLRQLSQEMEIPILIKPYPLPVPLPPGVLGTRKVVDNSKKKRSFIFYDDLSMRDTLFDNDYNFDDVERKNVKFGSPPRQVEEDIRPCSSCGGKNKKPPSKTDSHVSSRHNNCECRKQQASCTCYQRKAARSVSDTWYSVFNMSAPLPFLTTKMRIFRKRRNIWLKIAPSITLSSLSGIFANANLSILFSSHVDIFQLEKSLRLQNHQLLIPKDNTPISRRKASDVDETFINFDYFNLNPNRVLAIDNSAHSISQRDPKFHLNIKKEISNTKSNNVRNSYMMDITNLSHPNFVRGTRKGQRIKRDNLKKGIQTVADLGYFPVSMNFLERCPNNKNHLCLNMLDDKVPAYSIKVKMPFRENAVIHRSMYKVKITRIVTDATTRDAMQVSIDIINEGLEMQVFSVFVSNCGMSCTATKSSVKKTLLPHIGETVTFLLPLITDSTQKHKRFKCDVSIKVIMHTNSETEAGAKQKSALKNVKRAEAPDRTHIEKMKTVAIRELIVETDNRCFCVWECNCHCISKLETHIDFNVCQKLTHSEEMAAGLLLHCQDGEIGDADMCLVDDNNRNNSKISDNESGLYYFLKYALFLLGIMLLLGLLKAIIGGCCSSFIDRCGFDYAQPGKGYDDSSRCRRFFINVVFFIVFPFFIWCRCFAPSEEDLLVASTEWQCAMDRSTSVMSEKIHSNSNHFWFPKSKGAGENMIDDCDNDEISDEENVILSQHIERRDRQKGREKGGEDIFDIDNQLNNLSLDYEDDVFEVEEDDEDEEANTKFILQALVNSRESLKKLLQNSPRRDWNMTTEELEMVQQAQGLVQALKSAQIVYRTLDYPVGNIRNIPYGILYCIQGYFLPCAGTEYEFITYHPLVQYHGLSASGKSIEILRPPVLLCPKEFSRVYANQLEVLKANDLTIHPPSFVPCINVSTLTSATSSVIKLTSEQSICGSKFFSAHKVKNYSPDDQRSVIPLNCAEHNTIISEESSQSTTIDSFHVGNCITQNNNNIESTAIMPKEPEITEDESNTKCQKFTCETIYE